MTRCVSVIVPSYNRAHLLERTLPTYLQPEVAELILVDDASTDETKITVERLAMQDSRIVYVRQDINKGQAAAKNVGILMAKSPYLYFGDDDSVLVAGTISSALMCLKEHKLDVVGVKALYMLEGETFQDTISRHAGQTGMLFDINRLAANFTLDVEQPVRLPFVPACLLLKTAIAREIMFDPIFAGSGYREETDFSLRCSAAGYIVAYYPAGLQINLPRAKASGGSWSHGWFVYEWSAIRNNWIFLKRHHAYLQSAWNLKTSAFILQMAFVWQRLGLLCRRIAKYLLKKGR